jgi:hypothetical protein
MAEPSKLWIFYHIKKEVRDGKEQTFFNRCGKGWKNKDDSFNVKLDYIPTGIDEETTFNLQPYKPKEKKEAESFSE